MVIESEKRNSHLQKNHIDLQLKFQNYKQCIDTSSASNAIFEINKLRKQLQGKDDTIRNLETQINITRMLNVGSTEGSCDQQALETDRIQLQDMITSLRIQLDGLKVENVSLKRRYDELSQANTHSLYCVHTEKLSALTAGKNQLKAQVTGKTSSGPSTSETPKVLAPGMYNLGKSKKASHPLKTENTNTEVLNTLHMDLCGPMRTESINGKKYILVIVDDYTRFGWVRFLRSKDETPQVIEKFIVKTQRALNATVRFVRTDNGTEFVNKTLDGWFESVGISHETSVPRSPQQNGVVERRNRTLMEAARTMLIFAKAPLFLWAEAVATACYTLNRSLVHTLHGKTYYELLKGKKPNLQYFRVFGSLCYPTNDYDDVGKLKAKADIGIFVGYAPTKKAYRIYNKRTRKIQETVHVAFDELTEGLTSVQTSSGLAPQQMTSVPNSTELELTALQSGRSRSALVKDPEPPSVPPTKKQVDDLFRFQCLMMMRCSDPSVVPTTRFYVPAALRHPRIANGSPSTQ
ncbi:retrovirus-related pol polyprotein from transposon TNT 1-94 [Tanacetum coccineum]